MRRRIKETVKWPGVRLTCGYSKDSDQPVNPRILISLRCRHSEDSSDYANVQGDLILLGEYGIFVGLLSPAKMQTA